MIWLKRAHNYNNAHTYTHAHRLRGYIGAPDAHIYHATKLGQEAQADTPVAVPPERYTFAAVQLHARTTCDFVVVPLWLWLQVVLI